MNASFSLLSIFVVCLVTLHAPNGALLTIDTHGFVMALDVEDLPSQHVATGTKSIVYMSGHKIGVTETREQVEQLIENCSD